MNMKTATGQILQASTGVSLETGNHTVGVAFEAEALRKAGEDGPYSIEYVALVHK
jgi:hypothetical protein